MRPDDSALFELLDAGLVHPSLLEEPQNGDGLPAVMPEEPGTISFR